MSVDDEPVLIERPRRSFYERYERAIIGSVSVLVVLALWQWAWSAGKISPLFFTGPSQILKRFVEEWTMGRLRQDIAYSGTNLLIGVGAAIASGVVIGVLIEHYAGAFPVWLAPVQVQVIPISEKANAYAHQVRKTLSDVSIPDTGGGLRVEDNFLITDTGAERLSPFPDGVVFV